MPLAPSTSMPLSSRLNAIISGWYAQLGVIFNPYRPELHYMRGPGPKWRAKYGATAAYMVVRKTH